MRNNVGQFLAKRAFVSPKLEAIVDADTNRRFTFEELNERCNRTASMLASRGVKAGDRVALLLMNGVEYVESFFAIAKLGAICVPLNWRLTPEELSYILRDAGAESLIFGGEFTGPVEELFNRGDGENGTLLETWIHLGELDRPSWAESYEEAQAAASADEPAVGADEDDLLYIMYTSGTTGLPKGAVHTHNTATWGVLTILASTDIRLGDRYLIALPLFHVGSLTPITCNVYKGVTSVVMRAFDPSRAWELVQEEKINVMLKVPAMLNFMLQVYDPEKYDISSVRFCWSGAAPVPVSLIEEYEKLGIEVHQVYGLTESCGPACVIGAEDAISRAGSTGQAFFHTDIRVVDGDGNDVGPEQAGEVLVRGKHVMLEYWHKPEATAETIVDDWLHTGDVATMDDRGFVTIQDRIKDMIISGGENVYPAEIESALMRHEGIVEAGVIGAESEKWGESPVAIVVRKDESLQAADVLDFCKDKLARFKQPVVVHFVDEIPRNPSGKILKRILRDQFPDSAPQ